MAPRSTRDQLTEVAVATIAVGAVGFLGREVAGDEVGLIAAALAAAYPMFWATLGDLYSESLYTVVVAILLITAYRLMKQPTWGRALVLGIVAGLAALCRGEALLFLPLLVIPVVLRTQLSRRGRGLLVLAACAGALLPLAPWTIYNFERFERPVLVTTSVGGVLAGANCDSTYHGVHIGGWNVFCAARVPAGRRVTAGQWAGPPRHRLRVGARRSGTARHGCNVRHAPSRSSRSGPTPEDRHGCRP